jgi:transcriptional regulator with XRE-family HTH domain
MTLRARFDAALGRSGYSSIAELARIIGISEPSIFEVLAGDAPGRKLLPKIADRLGVHERWLRFGDDDVKPPWALSKDLADPLHALTAAVVGDTKQPKPKLLDVLSEILSEQRRIRVLLETCVAQDPPAKRHATIRRAADGDGSPVISTREQDA